MQSVVQPSPDPTKLQNLVQNYLATASTARPVRAAAIVKIAVHAHARAVAPVDNGYRFDPAGRCVPTSRPNWQRSY